MVLWRQLANSSPHSLRRAIQAYRALDLGDPTAREPVSRPRSKRAKTLSPAELERIREGYLAGATTAELGRQFGVDRQTVQRKLRAVGVRMRGSSLTPDEVERAATLYQDGLSLEKVATELRLGDGAVRNALIRAGVPLRDTHGRTRS